MAGRFGTRGFSLEKKKKEKKPAQTGRRWRMCTYCYYQMKKKYTGVHSTRKFFFFSSVKQPTLYTFYTYAEP